MIVTLDGNRVGGEFDGGRTLRNVIDQVRGSVGDDRLIVSVALNGQVCNDAELESRLEAALPPETQIDLEMGSRAAVVQDALHAAMEALDTAEKVRSDATADLHAGRSAAGVARLSEFARLWQGTVDVVVNGGRLIGQDWTTHTSADGSATELINEFHGALKTLRDALEAGDTVALADILHYEFPPLAQRWRALLDALLAVLDR